MAFSIRRAERRDYPAIAELQSLARRQTIAVEDIVALDSDDRIGSFIYRVVGELAGEIVGPVPRSIRCGTRPESIGWGFRFRPRTNAEAMEAG